MIADHVFTAHKRREHFHAGLRGLQIRRGFEPVNPTVFQLENDEWRDHLKAFRRYRADSITRVRLCLCESSGESGSEKLTPATAVWIQNDQLREPKLRAS